MLQLPDRVQKASSLLGCARSLQRCGEQPPGWCYRGCLPCGGAEPAPLPSPFCVCVSFPCRCAERNTPQSTLLAKTGAAGRRFRLWFHGTLLVVWLGDCSEQRRYRRLQQLLQNQTQHIARTKRLQFLVTFSLQRAHLVVGQISWHLELFLSLAMPAPTL